MSSKTYSRLICYEITIIFFRRWIEGEYFSKALHLLYVKANKSGQFMIMLYTVPLYD